MTVSAISHPKPLDSGDDEVDQVPTALLNGVGVGALLVLLFWMLAKEHLVTGPAHRRELADKDRQLAEKNQQIVMWQAVAQTEQAQNNELLEQGRLSVQHWGTLAAKAEEGQGSA